MVANSRAGLRQGFPQFGFGQAVRVDVTHRSKLAELRDLHFVDVGFDLLAVGIGLVLLYELRSENRLVLMGLRCRILAVHVEELIASGAIQDRLVDDLDRLALVEFPAVADRERWARHISCILTKPRYLRHQAASS